MLKLFCIGILGALTLAACEQQKQASAEVGAIPKTIIDKATNDINAVEALAAEQAKALENIEAPAEVEQ
jgi:hypothetical protein